MIIVMKNTTPAPTIKLNYVRLSTEDVLRQVNNGQLDAETFCDGLLNGEPLNLTPYHETLGMMVNEDDELHELTTLEEARIVRRLAKQGIKFFALQAAKNSRKVKTEKSTTTMKNNKTTTTKKQAKAAAEVSTLEAVYLAVKAAGKKGVATSDLAAADVAGTRSNLSRNIWLLGLMGAVSLEDGVAKLTGPFLRGAERAAAYAKFNNRPASAKKPAKKAAKPASAAAKAVKAVKGEKAAKAAAAKPAKGKKPAVSLL